MEQDELVQLRQELAQLRYEYDSLLRSWRAMIDLKNRYATWCEELESGHAVVHLVHERNMWRRLFYNMRARLGDALEHFGMHYMPVPRSEAAQIEHHELPASYCLACRQPLSRRLRRIAPPIKRRRI